MPRYKIHESECLFSLKPLYIYPAAPFFLHLMGYLQQLRYYDDYITPFYSELYRNFQTGFQVF